MQRKFYFVPLPFVERGFEAAWSNLYLTLLQSAGPLQWFYKLLYAIMNHSFLTFVHFAQKLSHVLWPPAFAAGRLFVFVFCQTFFFFCSHKMGKVRIFDPNWVMNDDTQGKTISFLVPAKSSDICCRCIPPEMFCKIARCWRVMLFWNDLFPCCLVAYFFHFIKHSQETLILFSFSCLDSLGRFW